MSEAPAPGRSADIEPFWLAYQRACQVKVPGFSASALGHTRALADTLAALVVAGVKRAQATPLRDFEVDAPVPPDGQSAELPQPDGQSAELPQPDRQSAELPQPGDHLVVLDGSGVPCAIVRTTQVEKRLFNQIDDAFAFEAGEGDLTLRWWLTAHRQDFAERAEAEGFEADERMELLLEYFEVVWPPPASAPDAADATSAANGLSNPA